MALKTKCKFYFGVVVEQDNNFFDFDEGSGEITITIPVGIYAPSVLANKISSLMSAAGSQTYSCIFNRTTRKFTISSVAPFDILIFTGSHSATTLYINLGFTGGADLVIATTYTAPSAAGFEYVPQFYLLDYTPLEHNIQAVSASVNETGSGEVEIIKYGRKRFMECSMELITNEKFNDETFWTSSRTGIEDTLTFLDFATQKGKIEFMPDKDDPETFSLLLLESTEKDQKGVGFKLYEQLEYGAGYFKTGKLVFREAAA